MKAWTRTSSKTELRRLRRECAGLVGQLRIPSPFRVEALCEQLGDMRGRPIYRLAMPRPVQGPCGLVMSTDTADFILYQRGTAVVHQQHIVLHELGHLMLEHSSLPPVMDEAVSRALMPHLDPRMVARMLSRSVYRSVEERQAEMVATLIQLARR